MVSPLQQALFNLPAPDVDDNCEWYTPSHIVEAARSVMGKIDLDPASCEEANRIVKATTFYTKEQDGLSREWKGRVWLNPPYGRGAIDPFVEKLIESNLIGAVETAIVLTNNCSDTEWWQRLANAASAICFLRGRLRFWGPQERGNSPTQGQTVMLLSNLPTVGLRGFPCRSRFIQLFSPLGAVR